MMPDKTQSADSRNTELDDSRVRTGRRPSILRELLTVVATSCAVLLIFAFLLTRRIDQLADGTIFATRTIQTTTALELEMRVSLREELVLVRQQFDTLDPDLPERLADLNFHLGRLGDQYLETDVETAERLTVERIRELASETSNLALLTHSLLASGERDAAERTWNEFETLASRTSRELDQLGQLQLQTLAGAIEAFRQTAAHSKAALLVLAILVTLLPIALFFLLRHWFLAPIARLGAAASRLRQGDYSARVPVTRPDELGLLAEDFNYMADALASDHQQLEARVDRRGRELESLQLQLRQSASRTAMGQLVSGVAHELNNPLTVIMGVSQLARDDEGLAPAQRTDAEMILHQAERCQRIVSQLAEYARPNQMERVEVNLSQLIEGLLATNVSLLDPSIELDLNLGDEPAQVYADPFQLEQVLVNLWRNARDALLHQPNPGGTIRIALQLDREVVSLVVEDDGPGLVDPERVFDPFYTTKDVGQGMGMGLAVSLRILEDHGGEIAASNRDSGARFTVRLPRLQEPSSKDDLVSLDTATLTGRGARVLLVEDEITLLDLQSQFLEQKGLEVRQALTIEEAIAVLRQESIDLVVSDFRIPGRLSGLDLHAWIQIHRPDLAARFILLTADIVGIQSYREQLTMPFLEKPFSWTAYERVLGRALGPEATSTQEP